MAAKTNEEKVAEAAAKQAEKDKAAEAKRLEEAQAEDQKKAADAAASQSAADVQAKAAFDLREKERLEEQARVAEDVSEPDSGEFSGHVVSSDFFSAATSDYYGHGQVEVRPAGWVGEGFKFSATKVKDLIKVLSGLKNLPEQEKSEA